MSISTKKRDCERHLSALRRRAAARDVSAMFDLGTWLQDGLQDKYGRAIVRRNPAAAFRLYLRAVAESGGKAGAQLLAYAYDVGVGTKPDKQLALRWYHRAARDGD